MIREDMYSQAKNYNDLLFNVGSSDLEKQFD